MINNLLAIKSVKKVYEGDIKALDEVSLEINPNEIVALLGSSGAGKSTLLKSIVGLVKLDEGEVLFKNTSVIGKNLKILRNSVATIYQNFNLVVRSSVIKNIMLGKVSKVSSWRILANIWPREIKLQAISLLTEVGLDSLDLHKRIENLSGGQQQRIGIARALIGSPEIILADEPVSNLDPQTAKEILSLLKEKSKENKISILCSLHQVELAKSFADRIIGMKDGRIVFNKLTKNLSEKDLNMIYKNKIDYYDK